MRIKHLPPIGPLVTLVGFVFFALAINLAEIDGHSIGWAYWYRLSTIGIRTQATVGRDPGEFGCYFRYRDGGTDVEGPKNFKCRLQTGSRVDVVYLPGDTSSVTVGSPRDMLLFLTLAPAALAIFAGLYSTLYARTANRRQ